MAKSKLRFGTGGMPLTSKGGVIGGIGRLRELGLEHLELEFVQSVFVSRDKAADVAAAAVENDISLSVHGSYYVNLAATEEEKLYASIERVVKAAEVGALCGARSVTYHSGFFQKQDPEVVFDQVYAGTAEILRRLQEAKVEIKIAPELTGKAAQFGDLPGLIRLVRKLQDAGLRNAALCIDFAHNYARHGGRFNTYEEFAQMLDDVATGLGPEFLEELHIHISAIEYGDKGEKNHLLLLPTLEEYAATGIVVEGMEKHWAELGDNRFLENRFDWRALLRALKQAGVGGFVVCESPVLELDALLMQQTYQQL